MTYIHKFISIDINIVVNFMDSTRPTATGEHQNKHKSISSTKQLQFYVANTYQQIASMLQERDDLQIQMPTEVSTAIERVDLIKSVMAYLLEERDHNSLTQHQSTSKPQEYGKQKNQFMQQKQQEQHQNQDQNNIFSCKNCQNYEKNLQKLEGEVRNHIRSQQQLKLYQDGLEDKIEEYKKQKKQLEKKYSSIKKKYEQIKNNTSMHTQRLSKYQTENQKLKIELKNYRFSSKVSAQDDSNQQKRLNRYESNKQNLVDWRNNGVQNVQGGASNVGQTKHQRVSIQRRNQSSERMRVSVNVKSTKGIPISSKILQQKNSREEQHKEKQKVIKNRIGY